MGFFRIVSLRMAPLWHGGIVSRIECATDRVVYSFRKMVVDLRRGLSLKRFDGMGVDARGDSRRLVASSPRNRLEIGGQ
jgi:hypothetical protein